MQVDYYKKGILLWLVLIIVTVMFVILFLGNVVAHANQVTLTFSVWGNPAELATWKEVITAFEEQYPDIKIKLLHQPVDKYEEKLMTMIAAGTPPDIIWLFEVTTPVFANQDVIHDLRPYIEKDKEFNLNDFYPSSLALAKFKEGIYGLPFALAPQVLYYNKTAFDKAGLSYPDETWTWADLLEAAKKLTIKENDKIKQWGIWATVWDVPNLVYIWQNGGTLFNFDNLFEVDPAKRECLLDRPEAYEAVQFFADMGLKHHIAPTPTRATLGLTSGMFQTGMVAMSMEGVWMIPMYREIDTFEWDIVPLPKRKARATILHTSYVTMSRKTKYPDAVWEFIKFYTGPKGQRIINKSLLFLPTRKSIAGEKPWFDPTQPPAHGEIIGEAAKYGRLLPASPEYPRISRMFASEIELIYLGEETAEEGLKRLKNEIDAILKAAE
jgi:multiple sugar transport system substrate-binding protein